MVSNTSQKDPFSFFPTVSVILAIFFLALLCLSFHRTIKKARTIFDAFLLSFSTPNKEKKKNSNVASFYCFVCSFSPCATSPPPQKNTFPFVRSSLPPSLPLHKQNHRHPLLCSLLCFLWFHFFPPSFFFLSHFDLEVLSTLLFFFIPCVVS